MVNETLKEIHIFDSLDQMVECAIHEWVEISNNSVKNKRFFSAALSGGKTPVMLYQKLSEKRDLPWEKSHIFMVDERFVPYNSDENNYHMINRTLLRHVNISPRNVHPISTSELTPQMSADRYESGLISFSKSMHTNLPCFDLLLLGIGEDGHTASLFPDDPALKETKRLAVSVDQAGTPVKERITITFPVINSASNIIFMASGERKAAVLREIIEKENSALPAARVRPGRGRLVFLLDRAAGALVRQ